MLASKEPQRPGIPRKNDVSDAVLTVANQLTLLRMLLIPAFIVDVGIYASLAITLVSGFHYIWHASRLLSEPA